MNEYVQLIIYIIIIAPIGLFWHELGHVLGARFVRAPHVTLIIGVGKPIVKRTYDNTTFILRRLFWVNSVTKTKNSHLLSKNDKVIITLMGPMSSLFFSILAYCLYVLIVPNLFVLLLCLFNLWLGIINLIPFKINERQSDGYTILQTLKNKYD